MGARFVVAAALTLMVAIAAGCGSAPDKGPNGAASDKAPTKAAFLKRANAICERRVKGNQVAAGKIFNGANKPTKDTLPRFVSERILPSSRKEIDAIRKLDPPEGDEDQVKAILDSADSAIDKVEANPKLVVALGGSKDPFAESNKLSRDYGLKGCGGA